MNRDPEKNGVLQVVKLGIGFIRGPLQPNHPWTNGKSSA
jgi:hypothetical protein